MAERGLTARVVAELKPLQQQIGTTLPDTRVLDDAMPATLKRFATAVVLLAITALLLTLSGGT